MTEREYTVYDVTGKVPENLEIVRQSAKTWNEKLSRNKGFFGATTEDARTMCEQILSKSGDPEKYGDDSPEGFAYRVLFFLEIANGEIAKGDADRAARAAFAAGKEWATALMKWRWEADAMRGTKVAGGARNSAHTTNERHIEIRGQRISRMAELVPEIGVDRAAATCAAEGLGPVEGIRRQWYRELRKPKNSDS